MLAPRAATAPRKRYLLQILPQVFVEVTVWDVDDVDVVPRAAIVMLQSALPISLPDLEYATAVMVWMVPEANEPVVQRQLNGAARSVPTLRPSTKNRTEPILLDEVTLARIVTAPAGTVDPAAGAVIVTSPPAGLMATFGAAVVVVVGAAVVVVVGARVVVVVGARVVVVVGAAVVVVVGAAVVVVVSPPLPFSATFFTTRLVIHEPSSATALLPV